MTRDRAGQRPQLAGSIEHAGALSRVFPISARSPNPTRCRAARGRLARRARARPARADPSVSRARAGRRHAVTSRSTICSGPTTPASSCSRCWSSGTPRTRRRPIARPLLVASWTTGDARGGLRALLARLGDAAEVIESPRRRPRRSRADAISRRARPRPARDRGALRRRQPLPRGADRPRARRHRGRRRHRRRARRLARLCAPSARSPSSRRSRRLDPFDQLRALAALPAVRL